MTYSLNFACSKLLIDKYYHTYKKDYKEFKKCVFDWFWTNYIKNTTSDNLMDHLFAITNNLSFMPRKWAV